MQNLSEDCYLICIDHFKINTDSNNYILGYKLEHRNFLLKSPKIPLCNLDDRLFDDTGVNQTCDNQYSCFSVVM